MSAPRVIHAEWVIWADPHRPEWLSRCLRLGFVARTTQWDWPAA